MPRACSFATPATMPEVLAGSGTALIATPSTTSSPASPAAATSVSPRVVLLVALLAVALLAAMPARAGAIVPSGTLTQLGEPSNCIGEEEHEVAVCGTLVHAGVNSAYEAQVSPDGKNVYSVAITGALVEYARDPASGALTVIGCVTGETAECAPSNVTKEAVAMSSPAAIALSPDGKSAYVVTQGANNAVVEFEREAGTGLLKEIGCISHESTSGCATKEAKGLNTPYGVTVSPDGANVYVASYSDEAVAEFARNTETGALEQLAPPNDCISSTALSGCGTENALGLERAVGVAVSPDGKDVYVAAGATNGAGAIAAFEREAGTGALKQLPVAEGCISTANNKCTAGIAINGPEDLAVSPDGKNVYANSSRDSAVIALSREASGALKQLAPKTGCVATTAAGETAECSVAKGIKEALGVAISPDGENLYVSGPGESAEAAFVRNVATGALTQLAEPAECVTANASGCGGAGSLAEFNERKGLEGARRVTVSPDGTNVYVAGQSAHAIVELARTVKPAVSAIVPVRGGTTGKTAVTIRGSGFREGDAVQFGSEPAVNVTVHAADWITAESPAGSGVQHVAIVNPAGESAHTAKDQFTYTNVPAVAGVSADVGSEKGGTAVTITGSGLTGATAVSFGAKPAASFTVESGETIKATSPPGAGTVDVTVKTGQGTSTAGAADKFAYVNGSLAPQSGLVLEGYCQSIGYQKVSREREEVSGPGYAYENWACVEGNGTEVPIANTGTGPSPSMSEACELENPGATVYAYPENPNDAFTWGCYKVVPPEENKGGSGGGTGPPIAKLASEQVGPVSVVTGTVAVPPPVLARTGNVAPVSGKVLVKVPGGKQFVPLTSLQQVPFGSTIEATNGTVSVTTALPGGKTQTGQFFGGEFILRQQRNGLVVAELTGGDFSVCPTARERAHRALAAGVLAQGPLASGPLALAAASGKHVVRKLWANAHGKFSTRGNYAAGAVQGTEWLTEDLCEGTLIRVTRDKVAVTNLVNHRHVTVKAGHKYLAKAP